MTLASVWTIATIKWATFSMRSLSPHQYSSRDFLEIMHILIVIVIMIIMCTRSISNLSKEKHVVLFNKNHTKYRMNLSSKHNFFQMWFLRIPFSQSFVSDVLKNLGLILDNNHSVSSCHPRKWALISKVCRNKLKIIMVTDYCYFLQQFQYFSVSNIANALHTKVKFSLFTEKNIWCSLLI